MGVGGISIWQLLIVLLIVILLFGTKKLRNIGSDVGGAIKTFRKSMKEDEAEPDRQLEQKSDQTADDEVEAAQKDKA